MDVLSLAGKRVRAASIRNILLATDGSAGAHRALAAAADLSRRSGAALHLVTAYEFAPSSVLAYAPYIGPESAWAAFESDARKLLDSERGRLMALGASVDGMYVARDPAFNAVMDVAQTVDADLVVVGSRELDALRRTLEGSVSERVVHSIHRPVLVVRGAASWPPAQILVGFDDSEGARGAARFAATLARLYKDSSIELVHAEPLMSAAANAYLDPDDEREFEQTSLQELAASLGQIAGRTVGTAAAVGDAADALVACATERPGASLIAVGTRGFGPVRRMLLGSVSTRLLHTAHGTLLVVPEHGLPLN
jgi:nucleotide-binding universal stress UspA family protein